MSDEDRWSRDIPVSPDVLDAVAGAAVDAITDASVADDVRSEALATLRMLVDTRLTARQREIVDLYFVDRLTQQEIAEQLGISQQVVSRQLFGVIRDGQRIGGAIKRLRQLCEEFGVDPARWV